MVLLLVPSQSHGQYLGPISILYAVVTFITTYKVARGRDFPAGTTDMVVALLLIVGWAWSTLTLPDGVSRSPFDLVWVALVLLSSLSLRQIRVLAT